MKWPRRSVMDMSEKSQESQAEKREEFIRFPEERSPYYEAAQRIAEEFSVKRKDVSCSVVIIR